MYNILKEYLEKYKTTIMLCLLIFVLTLYYAPYFMNKTFNGEFDGSIQNKLVWSVKGECYFVRPLNQTDTLLVRVTDCDKGNK
jgi:hypothetical protein